MTTHAYSVDAWLTDPSQVEAFFASDAMYKPRPELTNINMSDSGWIQIGTATVSIQVTSQTGVLLDAAAKIDDAISKLRADTQVKINALSELRSNLLALEYEQPKVKPEKPHPDFSDVEGDDSPF